MRYSEYPEHRFKQVKNSIDLISASFLQYFTSRDYRNVLREFHLAGHPREVDKLNRMANDIEIAIREFQNQLSKSNDLVVDTNKKRKAK